MKLGILFSGGKDSMYAAWLAREEGYEIGCLISVFSDNEESWMFHTPNIELVRDQAEVMGLPLVVIKTKGKKEIELKDLEKGILMAVRKYGLGGVVTGAVGSVYQASRVQKICNKLRIECFNPLWEKDQEELLDDLIKNKFEVVVSGVFAYPLDERWLGREINKEFVREMVKLKEKYKVNVAGEGGEYESLVLNCPMFRKGLKIKSRVTKGKGNSFSMGVELE